MLTWREWKVERIITVEDQYFVYALLKDLTSMPVYFNIAPQDTTFPCLIFACESCINGKYTYRILIYTQE